MLIQAKIEAFQARLQHEDEDTLKKWVKLAAKADSIEAFLESTLEP